MPRTQKKLVGMSTIDVELVVIRTGDEDSGMEYAVDTASKIGVEPQTETVEAIKNVKLGRVLAQKPEQVTLTGHKLTLTDNVFTPELVKVLQGGTIEGEGTTLVYKPPVVGSKDKGEVFEMDCYSAVYNASGQITMYEKITYPGCQGSQVPINTEDDVFRVPEYTITSMANTGQEPYTISYVEELPSFSDALSELVMMTAMSVNETVSEEGEQGTPMVGTEQEVNESNMIEAKKAEIAEK